MFSYAIDVAQFDENDMSQIFKVDTDDSREAFDHAYSHAQSLGGDVIYLERDVR